MIEYIVGHVGGHSYTVAKFNGAAQPEAVYEVDYSRVVRNPANGAALSRCNCMAWRSGKTRPCKHVKLVEAWLFQGCPSGHSYPPQEGDPR